MRIAVHVPVFGRHQAFRIFASWAIKSEVSIVICIVSNNADKELAEEYGFKTVYADNKPFSAKLQTGLMFAKQFEFDALLFMGSDDTLEGLDKYKEALKNYNFIACGDCHFKDMETNRVGYWPGYTNHRKGEPAGAGRCFRRDLLDALDWDLWIDCPTYGPDGHQYKRLHTVPHTKKIFTKKDGVILTDHKDKDSLTKFNKLLSSIKPV
jgi:hypothetical protein